MSTISDSKRVTDSVRWSRSVADHLAAFLARHRARRTHRRMCAELQALPDRMLNDIGVTRGEILGLVAEIQRTGDSRAGRS